MRPKSCAKTLDSHCDLDSNGVVSLPEWTLCLGIVYTGDAREEDADSDAGYGVHNTSRPAGLFSQINDRETDSSEETRTSESRSAESQTESQSKDSTTRATRTIKPLLQESSDVTREFDCLTKRRVAQEMAALNPDGHEFIPECLATGGYVRAQCHEATGYCWCVDDVTGRPIPGSSTQGRRPDCDVTSRRTMRSHPDEGTQFRTFPVPK